MISRTVTIEYTEDIGIVEVVDDGVNSEEYLVQNIVWESLSDVDNTVLNVLYAQDYNIAALRYQFDTLQLTSPKYRRVQDIEESMSNQLKYFVYQPSGGWGNQRIILQDAIAAANAMGRTLVLPPVAPHNFLYRGYNRFNGTEMSPMDTILDMDILNEATKYGIVVWNESLASLQEYWKEKSWKIFSKPREVNGKKLTYQARYIEKNWGKNSKNKDYDVVFWNKEGMWLCCAPAQVYAKNIVLNNEIKLVSRILTKSIDEDLNFNAVHIRRGGGHTGHDRKNVRVYYEKHLTSFEKEKPLYIATDEKNMKWFLPFITEYNFSRVLFLQDLMKDEQNNAVISILLKKHPSSMENDILGFIEQITCASATMFEGSSKSTFSFAINTIRRNPKALLGFS